MDQEFYRVYRHDVPKWASNLKNAPTQFVKVSLVIVAFKSQKSFLDQSCIIKTRKNAVY